MILFWLVAALMVALVFAFLLPPLLRNRASAAAPVSRSASNLAVFRDQLAELEADIANGTISREQSEAARAELQRGLLEDVSSPAENVRAAPNRSWAAVIAVAVTVPLLSVLLYFGVGNPGGLEPSKQQAGAQGAPHELSPQQMEGMLARLAQRMEAEPGNGEGWVMLARSYATIGRWNDAVAAFAKAEALFPEDAQLLADYADTLAMAQGQRLQGKPEALVQRALKADGNNLKALALAGTVGFEKGDFAKAIEHWQRMLPLLPPDSEMGNSVRSSIKEAQGKLGGAAKSVVAIAPASTPVSAPATQGAASKSATPPAAGATASAKSLGLSGTIKLAPSVAARAGPDDTVFVLARPAQGSRMPLAAVRVKVKELPYTFSFDDSMAMSASAKLSDFTEVVVAARVSKSGNVMPERGDLEGVSKPVRPGLAGLVVEISKEVQ
jgi:cytochrome c-type biogenesis protein CcmH